ncbi:hypothetical protein AAF712_006287 [Marasmius tenuissimus]|uniref:Transmembrane protein n=1 Tax=Marasmius tenuissimus TaxID=585030 RepID=A0ABR3A0X5_9AGAR|nr:hypothetical protein PM082_021781 [Marasmius tenuissimus]
MPSFRTISLFFVASLASLSFTSAAPQYTPPTDVHYEGVPSGCDAGCMAKSYPVPVILADIKAKIAPKLEEIHALAEVKVDTIKPIVADITVVIDDAAAKVKAYVDAKVDLKAALAANAEGGAAVTVDVLVRTFISLVASIVVCIKAALKVAVKGELDLVIKIFATLCVRLAFLLQVCCQLVVGLAVSLAIQLTAFIALCVELGISASVDFLKVAA